jgi:hypothetical protein
MRIFEIADAEAQLALWKLVNDSVWTAIQTQQHEQAKQKAEAQQQKKSKRSKRISKRSISAPAPLPKIPKPIPKLAAPNKLIANPPQQQTQKLPTPTNANLNPQPYPQAKTAFPPKSLPTTSATPTANASSPTNSVAAQINPIQHQRQQPLPPQNALSAQKKRVYPNKRA